jgi:hypothetical protein
MADALSNPIFPETLDACHARIGKLQEDLSACMAHYEETERARAFAENACSEARMQVLWLQARVQDTEAQFRTVLEQREAAKLRAESVESILEDVRKAALFTDRVLSVSAKPDFTLCAVYELGSVVMLTVLKARAPPHPRLLLEELLELIPAGPVHGADAESRVHDEDPAVAAGVSSLLGMSAAAAHGEDHGNECDAHARARQHQRSWAAAVPPAAHTSGLHFAGTL